MGRKVIGGETIIAARVRRDIADKLRRLAQLRGIDVSDVIRMAVLRELAEAGLLPEEQARALGVSVPGVSAQ